MLFRRLAPGFALCVLIAAAAWVCEAIERRASGQAPLEAIVLAILLGAIVRTAWTPAPVWKPGIDASAKQLLETAVVLLGASVDVPLMLRAGPALAIGIFAVVIFALTTSYGISRLMGLHHKLALLVACGNSICGNSAIAAVAPVIGAEPTDIASSIAFTAVLGVVVVLGLPLVGHLLAYSPYQFGVLAGLSVYAVPQVLAVTIPVSAVSAQVGTLVKLVRVLMLGPVVVVLSLWQHRRARAAADAATPGAPPVRLKLSGLVPWFIIGFIALAALRSVGAIPEGWVSPVRTTATVLTVISMAALGLGVDVRVLRRVGVSVTMAVSFSLIVLICVAIALIAGLRVT